MADRPVVDWEAVEREYRAGVLSVREIAKGAGVSHPAIIKRAKKEQWTQNLAARVREEVTARLVTAEVTVGNSRAAIAEIATRSVDVIVGHRRSITRLRDIIAKLTDDLAADGEKPEAERLCLKDRAVIIESIGRSQARMIQLERQAFGLDDDTKAPDVIEATDAASPRSEVERRIARLTAPG